jgi:tetratricopeptide (TPR) repeat protein
MPEETANLLDTYRSAVAANPTSAEAHCNLGMGYYGDKRYEEAIKEFEAALKLDRNFLDAHYGLALALKASGEKKEAIAAFEKAATQADKLDDHVRGTMLNRLIEGHITDLKTGEWSKEAKRK